MPLAQTTVVVVLVPVVVPRILVVVVPRVLVVVVKPDSE
jgi:hypothetical protein